MFCQYCGTELKDDELYCWNCGEKQESAMSVTGGLPVTDVDKTPGAEVKEILDFFDEEDEEYTEDYAQKDTGSAYADNGTAYGDSTSYGSNASGYGYAGNTVPEEPVTVKEEKPKKMYYCTYCGTAMEPTETYCYNCSNNVVKEEDVSDKVVLGPWTVTKSEYEYIKSRDRFIMWFAHLAIAFCAFLIIKPVLFRPSVNITPYVTVEFDGYDEYGTARAVFDYEGFNEAYKVKFKAYETDKSNLLSFIGRRSARSMFGDDYDDYYDSTSGKTNSFLSNCSYELSQYDHLSNGDTVALNWTFNNDTMFERYGFDVRCKTLSFDVAGLEEPREFDPFDDVKVVFNGYDTWGEAYIESDNYEIYQYGPSFYFSDNYGLSNGDVITVRFGYYDETDDYRVMEDMITQYGLKPVSLKKKCKVSGLTPIDEY